MWIRVLVAVLLLLTGSQPLSAAGMAIEPTLSHSGDSAGAQITAGHSETTTVQAGAPAIDFERAGATGLPPNALVVIGNQDAPASDHAFAIRNRGSTSVSVSVAYRYDDEVPATAGLRIHALDHAGVERGGWDRSTTSPFDISPGETVYLVITISTHGATPADDLSGRFEVTTVDASAAR